MKETQWVHRGDRLARFIGWSLLYSGPLLAGVLGSSPAVAQTAPNAGAVPNVEQIRKQFAIKDATIAALRQQLAARDAEIIILRRRLSPQPASSPQAVSTPQTVPPANGITLSTGTPTATQSGTQNGMPPSALAQGPVTSVVAAVPVVHTRLAQGPSDIGSTANSLYATDMAVTDSSAAFADTPGTARVWLTLEICTISCSMGSGRGITLPSGFTVSRPGTYTVETVQFCTGGQGCYKVEVDGVGLAREMDFGDNNRQNQGQVPLSVGEHTLTYRSDGTASDKAGYGVKGTAARIYRIDFTSAN